MKRLITLLILLFPIVLMSQNINFVGSTTLTASKTYTLSTTTQSGPWALYALPGTVSGTCTVDCQVSPDGSNWIAYPGTVQDTLASNTVSNEYYPTLAKILFELAVELRDKTGADIKFINLSGGVGVAYKPEQTPNDIAVIGEGVHKVYDEVLTPAGMGDVAIYTELGRFMLAPYGCLVTKAIHEKHTHKEYIGVDACAANLMRPAIYGAYHHITVAGKENAPCDHVYDVVGSLCENCDKFAIDRKLPKIDRGDYLIIHDAGAHGFSMGYNYNGRLRSAELLLKEDGSVEMIRRAETPKDYFATFDYTDFYKKLDL